MGTLRVEPGSGPFRREHDRLLRTALQRGDESAEDVLRGAKLGGAYRARTLAIAIETWRERMRGEHHSAAVFSRLLPLLIEAESSLDLKTAVLKMSMDELRHAALAAGVVRLLGGEPELKTELKTEPLPEHPDTTRRASAARNVMFIGCLCETFAVSSLSEEHELTTEPAIKTAIAQLLRDEIWHAKLGWVYLGEVWPTLTAEERSDLNAYLPVAFESFEARVFGPANRVRFDDALTDELACLGVPAPQTLRELYADTVSEVIRPRLRDVGLAA